MLDHPEGLPQQPYTVYGCWEQTRERFEGVYQAGSPRAAENLAQMDAADKGGTLWIARVVAGQVAPVDTYTAYVDPQDARNADIGYLEPDTPDFADGDPEWTVFGFAVPKRTKDAAVPYTAERYGDVVNATSPGAAEDVARDRLADKGGDLWVVTVLAGRIPAVDTYATFADPDVRPRTTS